MVDTQAKPILVGNHSAEINRVVIKKEGSESKPAPLKKNNVRKKEVPVFPADYRPKNPVEKCQERFWILSDFISHQETRDQHDKIKEYRFHIARIEWMMACAKEDRSFLYERRQLEMMRNYYLVACSRILHNIDSQAYEMLYEQFTRDYEATPPHLMTDTKAAQLWNAVFDTRACYAQPLAKDFCNTCVRPLLVMKREANLVCPQCSVTTRDLSPHQSAWIQQPIKHEKLFAMRNFVEKNQQKKDEDSLSRPSSYSPLMVDSPVLKATVPFDSLANNKWSWKSSSATASIPTPIMLPSPVISSSPDPSPASTPTPTAKTATTPKKNGQKRKKDAANETATTPKTTPTKKIKKEDKGGGTDVKSEKSETDVNRFAEKIKTQLERFRVSKDKNPPEEIILQVHLFIKTRKNIPQHESTLEKYVIDALKSNEMKDSGGKKYLKHSARIAAFLTNNKFEDLSDAEYEEVVERSRLFEFFHRQSMPDESIPQSLVIHQVLKMINKHRIARYFASQRTPQCFPQQIKTFQTIVGFIKSRPLSEKRFEYW